MPITIKTGLMKYKSQSTGDYIGINAVSDNETAAQIAAIEQKGAEVLEGLPSDYTELAQDVSELKNDPKIYVVTENESGVLNKTWKEIVDASENHTVCLITEDEDNGNTTSVSVSYFEDAGQTTGLYCVKFSSQGEFYAYTTNSQNGYPNFNEDASRSIDDDIRSISDKIDNNILAQQTQPTAEDNKLWIDTTEQATPVQVASYEELTAVSNALNQSNAATSSDIGKAHSPKTVVDGKVTEWQYIEVGGGGGGDLPSDFPTDETAQELLEYETYNAGLTDTALAVIGMLFTNLPQDETATDILHSLELECERLDLIYNGWIAEREGA